MKPLYEQHRVRYPPFEAARWRPEALPMAKKRHKIDDYATKKEAMVDCSIGLFCPLPPIFMVISVISHVPIESRLNPFYYAMQSQ